MMKNKSLTIKKIENGYVVEMWLPSKRTEIFKKEIDDILAEAKLLLG